MSEDPRATLRARPMRPIQVLAIALCIVAVMIDGFDILAASFTAPAIAHEWNASPDELGLLFSASLLGMVLGAMFLSPVADLWGRRRAILGGMMLATLGMAASAVAPGLWALMGSRLVTGFGVAGVLTAANTLVAEYASEKRRDLAVIFQAAGFPLGGLIGGVGVLMAPDVGWRTVYGVGALVAVVVIALLFAAMPESLDYLIVRRPARALERVNALAARLDVPPLDALPDLGPKASPEGPRTASTVANTALISLALFLLMFSFYFFTSWTPKLLTDYGLSRRVGVSGAMFMSLGGIAGDVLFGLLMLRFAARQVGPAFLAGAFFAGAAFAVLPLRIGALMPNALLLGSLLYGAMASLYAVVPTLFAAPVRTTGTGLAMGLGRIGAALGPYIGGLMIAAHWSRIAYLTAMAAPMLAAAVVGLALSEKARHGLPEGRNV